MLVGFAGLKKVGRQVFEGAVIPHGLMDSRLAKRCWAAALGAAWKTMKELYPKRHGDL
jgi:hypothetical protein